MGYKQMYVCLNDYVLYYEDENTKNKELIG
jgi:hypothetical protein